MYFQNKNFFQLFFPLILLGSLFIVAGKAIAGTYWVSPSGTASWIACEGEIPLDGTTACSISTSNANANAGDTVYFRGGFYSDRYLLLPVNSGTLENKIVFEAYNDEEVVLSNQQITNASHEDGAWVGWGGPVSIEQSSEKAWDGTYSTKFTVDGEGEGIKSESFSWNPGGGYGSQLLFRVYSDQTSINLLIQSADGTYIYRDLNVTIPANQWGGYSAYQLPAQNTDYNIIFRSPAGVNSGVYYVDYVRLFPYQSAVYINGKDNIVVKGMTITDVHSAINITRGADYNEIDDCIIEGPFFDYFSTRIWENTSSQVSSTYNWIHDCTFHTWGYITRTAGDVESCDDGGSFISVGGTSLTEESNYNLIENNTLYYGGHDLAIIRSKYNTFRNNIMHNEGFLLSREGRCQDADGDVSTFNSPSHFGNRGLLFENYQNMGGHNLAEGNRMGFAGVPPDDDGSNGFENPADHNIFRYNSLFKNGGTGFYFKAQPGLWQEDVLPDYNYLYNNTIYANGGDPNISDSHQVGIFMICDDLTGDQTYWPLWPTGNIIKNNINYANVYRSTTGSWCQGYEYTNNLEVDPAFVNPDISDPFSATLPNLNLQPSSVAIDGAVALTVVSETDSGTGLELYVEDSKYFQDGTYAPPGRMNADHIAIGSISNAVQISSIDYFNNKITLSNSVSREGGDDVWLYRKSDGVRVLYGSAPDYGAYEFVEESELQADFDSDSDVDIFDYSILIANFGTTGDCENPADADGDCNVGIFDYNILLEEFGSGA